MSGRRNRKRGKSIKPDEYFAAGPIEIARFGKLVSFRSNFTPEQFAQLQQAFVDRLPDVVAEIDKDIGIAAELVSRLPPDRIMHRSWWGVAAAHFGIDNEADMGSEQTHAVRMVDYVQSLIASVPRATEQKSDVGEEDWDALSEAVKRIFDRHNREYQISIAARNKADNPNINPALEEFRFQSEMFWVNIRGKRYQLHDPVAIEEQLEPHDAVIQELFGVSSAVLLDGLHKVWRSLTFGLGDAADVMVEFQSETRKALARVSSQPAGAETEADWKEIYKDEKLAALGQKMAGLWQGLDLFDVGALTGWPSILLDELSWSPGEDIDFFADGEFKGWPLRVWPVFKRPFLKLGGKYYGFDLYSLFDNFYRVMQRTVCRLKPAYKDEWARIQQAVSEELPAKYFERLLPGLKREANVYYRWRPAGAASAQWFELDNLFSYADQLFVVEVKAGSFTYTPPATDLPAHLKSLENLVLKGSEQSLRFIDYAKSADTVALYDKDHKEIGQLRLGNFRHVTPCAITLDAFTEIAAQSQHLDKLGLGAIAKSVWTLSIDDLRVYADMFDNPVIFLHYAEQRLRAQQSDELALLDELDHLGLYAVYNNYSQFADESSADLKGRIQFTGHRAAIDKRYAQALRDDAQPVPITQDMHPRLKEAIDFLGKSNRPDRSRIASYLLDVGGEFRDQFFGSIDADLTKQLAKPSPRLMSSHGDVRLTLYARLDGTTPANDAVALDHTRAVMVLQNEPDRKLIELVYDGNKALKLLNWREVDLDGVSDAQLTKLREQAETIRQQRVAQAPGKKKPGRNDQCPCGSGKKFKKCCLS